MEYFTIREVLFAPFRTARRFVASVRVPMRGKQALGRSVLKSLLKAGDGEITAREKLRRGLQLDDSRALRKSGDFLVVAILDLKLASYFWKKILISCNVDYKTWHALEEAIRNAREIDNAIKRAIQNGNYDEVESLFDKAMEYKLTAIELAKSYLENLNSAATVDDPHSG